MGGYFLKDVFKTVITILWWSDNPVETVVVLWKLKGLLVINRSMQDGLVMLLKQVLLLTIFLALWVDRKFDKIGSESSALKSPINKNLS